MLDVPPTRNYLRLAVAIRFAMTVLLLAAPTLFKSLWGIESSGPAVEDRAWGWANESFALLALQLYGLFSHDDETRINVAFVAGLAAFLMSMSTSAFFGSFAPLLTARSLSLTAITLFGVFSGWREGVSLRRRKLSSDPVINIAMALSMFYVGGRSLYLLVDPAGFAASSGIKAATDSTIIAWDFVNSFATLAVTVATWVLYTVAPSEEARTTLGLIWLARGVRRFASFELLQVAQAPLVPKVVIPLVFLALLVEGIRRNYGNKLSISGPLGARNTLAVVCLIGRFHWVTHTYFRDANLSAFMSDAAQKAFLAPAPLVASAMHANNTFWLVSLWALSYMFNNRDAIRVSLVSSVAYHGLISAHIVVQRDAWGFTSLVPFLLPFALMVYSFKALVDDLRDDDESFGSWIRHVFQWSYSPLKGGVYLQCIHALAWGVYMLLDEHSAVALMVGPVQAAANGTSVGASYATPQAHITFQLAALVIVTLALTTYVIERVVTESEAHILAWFCVAQLVQSFMTRTLLRNDPLYELVDVGTRDAVIFSVLVVAHVASQAYAFWKLDRQGRKKRA